MRDLADPWLDSILRRARRRGYRIAAARITLALAIVAASLWLAWLLLP